MCIQNVCTVYFATNFVVLLKTYMTLCFRHQVASIDLNNRRLTGLTNSISIVHNTVNMIGGKGDNIDQFRVSCIYYCCITISHFCDVVCFCLYKVILCSHLANLLKRIFYLYHF